MAIQEESCSVVSRIASSHRLLSVSLRSISVRSAASLMRSLPFSFSPQPACVFSLG